MPARAAAMAPGVSTRRRFSTVFMSILVVVGVLGAFSIWRLTDYHQYSSDIRDRFFKSTRFIGDLNNYTSDFRAAEAASLLISGSQVAANDEEVAELDRQIATAERRYEEVRQDRDEAGVYQRFHDQWTVYRAAAAGVIGLSQAGLSQAGLSQGGASQAGRRAEALRRYLGTSRLDYDAASDTLGALTDLNVAKAHRAALRADQAYAYARELTGAAVGLAIVLVGLALTYVRRVIANPLLDLSKAMLSLARGETNIGIPSAGRADELGEMARAVITFRDSIIELAIAQRTAANQALLLGEKLAAEQRLTELQRNFVSMASHEFRTPMNIIDSHAQRLINARDRLGPDDVAERARKIRAAILRLTSVIDNLIGTSRVTDGDMRLYHHPGPLDLREVLADVCRLHREVAPRANLQEGFEQVSLPIVGDRKLLYHAFSNLVSNAIKFSTDGSPIRIGARSEFEGVVVTVEDRGLGVPVEDLEHLFERYFRARNARSIVGTGIGLYLVKTVIDLHDGAIVVESVEGRGSTFVVRLPSRVGSEDNRGATDAPPEALHRLTV